MTEPMEERPATKSWRMSLVAVAVVAGALLIWHGRLIFIIGFLGLLLGLVISRAVDWLEKHGWNRALSAILIMLMIIGVFVGGGVLLAPTLREQFRGLQQKLPEVIANVEQRLARSPLSAAAGVTTRGQQGQQGPAASGGEQGENPQQGEPGQNQPAGQGASPAQPGAGTQPQQGAADEEDEGFITETLGDLAGPAARLVFPVLSTVAEALSAIVIIMFVALFFAVRPGRYKHGAVRLFPPHKRERAQEVFTEVGEAMTSWMVARLMAMVAVGLITGVTLGFIGIDSAIALGVIAGILEFVPFFGPILAAIPAVGLALLDSPEKALATVIAFVVIQQLEGNLLTPLLLENRVDVPPLMTILTVPLLTVVVGAAAVLIAEPLLAIGIVIVRELWLARIEEGADGEPRKSSSEA